MANTELATDLSRRNTRVLTAPPPTKQATSASSGTSNKPQAQPVDLEPETTQAKPEPGIFIFKGTFEPGSEGYGFNKTAKVKAEVVLDGDKGKDISGLVSFSLFSKFEGNPEQDMGVHVDSGVRKGIADAEVTLFHNDAYYDAGMPPDKKVKYYFKAKHQKSEEKTSEELEMPVPLRIKSCDGPKDAPTKTKDLLRNNLIIL